MISISGNTYAVRTQLAALGGKWNAATKQWMVPADRAAEARKLVAGAAKTSNRNGGLRYKDGMSYYDRNGCFVLGDDD
jgi:hypothetical protein